MSDGIRHYEVWRKGWVLALPLSVSVYGITDLFRPAWNCLDIHCISGNTFYSLGVLGGYWIGRYLDPDLDQIGTTSSEGRMINEIPIIGHFLYGYWSIYGAIFRRNHRSFITHFPIFSTFIRIIYQFWAVFLIVYLKDWNFSWVYQIFTGIFIGLSFADFLHWVEDKKSLRKR